VANLGIGVGDVLGLQSGTRWNGFHFFGLKQEWKHE
jgi:hypothetical protein